MKLGGNKGKKKVYANNKKKTNETRNTQTHEIQSLSFNVSYGSLKGWWENVKCQNKLYLNVIFLLSFLSYSVERRQKQQKIRKQN